jgi:hypothetical protein
MANSQAVAPVTIVRWRVRDLWDFSNKEPTA